MNTSPSPRLRTRANNPLGNWFGGEAVSLQINYTHSDAFRRSGYIPMTVNGIEYGETREYGNFSFTRIYEAGHEVPYYQPIAALALFNRTINGWDSATGQVKVTADLGTMGNATATHTESFVPLPSATGNDTASAGGLLGKPILRRGAEYMRGGERYRK